MSNVINISIDLTQLSGASLQGDNIIIPCKQNDIYITDKNKAYLSLVAQPSPSSKFGETHYVKRRLSKAVYNAMTQEERNRFPIIGSAKEYVYTNTASNTSKNEPTEQRKTPKQDSNVDINDMPF